MAEEKTEEKLPSMYIKVFAYIGFGLFGFMIGYITGNSVTSVSGIVVASMLGFMGSIVTAIIGSNDSKNLDQILVRLGIIFFCFAIGLAFGIGIGAHLKGAEKIFSYILPSISHDMGH